MVAVEICHRCKRARLVVGSRIDVAISLCLVHNAIQNDHLAIKGIEGTYPKITVLTDIPDRLDAVKNTLHQGIDGRDLVQYFMISGHPASVL